ncbi:MAG: trehalose-phosphatase [candidate division Zixibacteria bacterium RBG_16_43_9]|nr:MAG: trehalose-phosphatase [candidate division Zixibacteria bacterium RBG_16_43_9]
MLMQYLLEKVLLRGLEEKIRKAQRVFLFLDYDGTLTSIQNTPDLALLSSSTRRTLQSLSSLPQMILTVISGRTLSEIQKLIGLDNVNYVGNHGLEMKVKSHKYVINQHKKIRKKISLFCQRIKRKTHWFSGVLVENKGLSASIHYRLAKEDCVPELKKIVSATIYPFKRSYELRDGKKVLEIRPKTKRNKGWAVNEIIHRYNSKRKTYSLYFYLGDDLTDEDAFQLVNSKRGYSIRVDKRKEPSNAHHYLKGPKEVRLFLGWFKRILTQKERRKP